MNPISSLGLRGVSFVVPIYNVARYLPTCLDSFLAQSDSNWEAIMIDDGSTDDSAAVCGRYVTRDARFKYQYQSNQGQGVARNVGVQRAAGGFVSFVDPDDRVHPDLVRDVASRMSLSDADFISFGLAYVNPSGKIVRQFSKFAGEYITGRDIFRCALVDRDILSSPCNKMYRRRFLIGHDIRFPPLRAYEDLYFARLLALHAEQCQFMENLYYFALVREGSTTRSMSAARAQHAVDLLSLEKERFFPVLINDEERALFDAHRIKFIGQIAFQLAFGLPSKVDFLVAHEVLFNSAVVMEVRGGYRQHLPWKNRLVEPIARRPKLLWAIARLLSFFGVRPY